MACRALRLGLLTLLFGTAAPALGVSPQTPPPRGRVGDERIDAWDAGVPDRLSEFEPVVPSSEFNRDQLDAAARFSMAVLLHRRGELEAAWRELTRAWRLDPTSDTLLRQVVVTTFELEQYEIAARYALLLNDHRGADPLLWPQLAAYLTDRMELGSAIRLYEAAEETSRVETIAPSQQTLLDFQLGRLYYLVGQSDRAVSRYRKVLARWASDEIDPRLRDLLFGEPGTWEMVGEAFLEVNAWDEAATVFAREQLFGGAEVAERAQLHAARIDHLRGDVDQALARLRPLVERSHGAVTDAPYLLYWRIVTDREGGLDPAKVGDPSWLGPLDRAFRRAPQLAGVGQVVAEHYARKGNALRAEAIWRKLDAYPERVASQWNRRAWSSLADTLIELIDRNGSLVSIEPVLVPELTNAASCDRLVSACTQQESWQGWLAAAWLSLWTRPDWDGDDRAEPFFHAWQAVPSEQRPAFGIDWAIELMVTDHPVEALALLSKVAESDVPAPRRVLLRYYQSLLFEQCGRLAESRFAAHDAYQLAPDILEIGAHWAWCLYRDRFDSRAQQVYARLLSRYAPFEGEPDDRWRLRNARVTLASLLARTGQMSEAESHLETVLDEFPADAGALNDLAYLWSDQGRHLPQALAMARSAVAAEPDNGAYHDTLGWAWYRSGDYQQAVTALREAVALTNRSDGIILDHLGDALWQDGAIDEAREVWQLAADRLWQTNQPFEADRIAAKVVGHSPQNLTDVDDKE